MVQVKDNSEFTHLTRIGGIVSGSRIHDENGTEYIKVDAKAMVFRVLDGKLLMPGCLVFPVGISPPEA